MPGSEFARPAAEATASPRGAGAEGPGRRRPQPPALDLQRLARVALVERADRLLCALGRVGRGDDPEAVHDLRVGSRRMREALATFEPLIPPRKGRRIGRLVRGLRATFGGLRNLEVIEARVRRALEEVGHTEAMVLEDFLLSVRLGIARERAAMKRSLQRVRVPRLAARLADLSDSVRALSPPPAAGPGRRQGRDAVGLPADVRGYAAVILARARARVHAAEGALAGEAPGPLHRLRIEVKRLRYQSECFDGLGLSSLPGAIDRMRAMQEILGTLQDLWVLEQALAESRTVLLGRGPPRRGEVLDRAIARCTRERRRTCGVLLQTLADRPVATLTLSVERELARAPRPRGSR